MKFRLLCAQFLVTVVLVESSPVPFSSQATHQASFQTGAYAAYSDTTSDDVTSVIEANNNTVDDDDIAQDTTECTDQHAAVGILDISGSTMNDSTFDGSKILLRNRVHDGSHTDEWWGVKKATSNNNCDENNLALSAVIGSSCDGFVLNSSDSIIDVINRDDLSSTDECLDRLDDVLLSLADSLIHRLQTDGSTSDSVIQVVIVFQEEEECNNDVKTKISEYIEKYMDRAISKLLSHKFGRTIDDSSPTKCDIEVMISPDSAINSAVQLVSMLPTKSLYSSSIQMIRDKLELIDNETITGSLSIDVIPKDDTARFHNQAEFAMAAASSTAEDDLYELENKMDDAILEGDGNEPMPGFGSDANALLTKVSEAYLNIISNADTLTDTVREWIENRRIEALKNVAGIGLHRLYHLHLQNLRDYFGRTYEQILDESSAMGLKEMEEENTVQARDQVRREGAKRSEEGFLNAAFISIPAICQDPEMGLGELYSCTEALRGLLEDMYEATLSRGIEEEEWNDVMDISAEGDRLYHVNNAVDSSPARVGLRELIKRIKNKRANRGPAKWYERLATKALVIGVNYVQGWIVLQTLRREARRRDLTMPKFPLF